MNDFPFTLISFSALIFSTGIISVASASFLTISSEKIFNADISHKNQDERAAFAKYKSKTSSLPKFVKRLYFLCHFPAFLLFFCYFLIGRFSEKAFFDSFLTFINEYWITIFLIDFWPDFSIFMVLGYILRLVWEIFRSKGFAFKTMINS